MANAKKRPKSHQIDAEGQDLLRQVLPKRCVLRDYRPDYGLDYALELFTEGDDAETLGEHIFIQLKTMESAQSLPLKIYGRINVEKARESLYKNDYVGDMHTIRISIDVPELVTVERMGIGAPVLLVVADLEGRKCYFVCLNDYIDKILIPRFNDYRKTKTRTIHVPTLNDLGGDDFGLSALRWYGKRAKLLAGFQRFIYQNSELDYAHTVDEQLKMAKYFASRIVQYDFWDDTEMWGMISYYGIALKRFLDSGVPGLMKYNHDEILTASGGSEEGAREMLEQLKRDEARMLWEKLALLPRNYEDVLREWYLPTALSYRSMYATINNGTTAK